MFTYVSLFVLVICDFFFVSFSLTILLDSNFIVNYYFKVHVRRELLCKHFIVNLHDW